MTVIDDSSAGSPVTTDDKSTWSVGSLTYTAPQLGVLFFWLLWGDFAWSLKERSAAPLAQIVLLKFHATDVAQSLFLVTLPAAVGVLLGPIVSFRSDRFRSRFGRRIPVLAATTPLAVLAMFGLGYSSAIGHYLHTLFAGGSHHPDTSALICFGLFWSLFEIATVAGNAVFGALVNDVVPHGFLGRFYGLFRALSLIAGIVFNFKLIGLAAAHSTQVFVAIGLLYGIGFAFMIFMVKEGTYPPPDIAETSGKYMGVLGAARLYMKECFANPYYRWVIGSMVIASLVFLPVNLYSLPYSQQLHITKATYGKYLALTYTISLCLSYFLGHFADKLHPLRVGIASMAIYAAAMLWGAFYAVNPAMYAVVFVAHGVLSGAYFTCSASLGQRLFPKLNFAQYASAAGMATAVGSIAVAPLVGSFLDYSGHLYRYTYGMGCGLAVIAVLVTAVVYQKFMWLGGDASYVPPSGIPDATKSKPRIW